MVNKTGKFSSGGSMLPHPMEKRPTDMSAGNTKTGNWSSKSHSASHRNPQGKRDPRGGKSSM